MDNHLSIPTIAPIFDEGIFRNTKKMTALLTIDRIKHIGINKINEKSAWVFNEPTTATVKHDGTGVLINHEGEAYIRRSVKKGRNIPDGFLLAEFDSFTETMFGVIPVKDSPHRRFFNEAVTLITQPLIAGTYELVGPKINGNPEKLTHHSLILHGSEVIEDFPDIRTMDPLNAYDELKIIFTDFKDRGIEGIVWWGSDNRRVKLRVNDFFGDPNRR